MAIEDQSNLRTRKSPMASSSTHLLAACKRIEEDCLYTGQTHFAMASRKAKWAKGWLVLLPSVVSALSGVAIAIGAANWVGAFAAVSGVVSGVATFLGVDKDAATHEHAGKLLTQLRHEARALADTYSLDMNPEQFASEVRALQSRYRDFVASLPITDDEEFEKVRSKIKSGTFQYDSEAAQLASPGAPAALPPPKPGGP